MIPKIGRTLPSSRIRQNSANATSDSGPVRGEVAGTGSTTRVRRSAGQTSARGSARLFCFFAALLSIFATVSATAQTAIIPGTVSNFGSRLTGGVAIALDNSQNAYVVTTAGSVYKETFSSSTGSYTESFLFTTSTSTGSSIAVDSTGALYVATGAGHTVEQYTGSGTSYTRKTTFSTGITGATAVAVDSSNNVYITDAGSGTLYEETPSGGSFTQTSVATGFSSPTYLTIDAANNLFIANATGTFYKVAAGTFAKSTLSVSGFSTVSGLAVDTSDNLFVAGLDTGVAAASAVYKATLNGGTYTPGLFYQTGTGIAVTGAGNVYLVDPAENTGSKITPIVGFVNFGSVGPGTPVSLAVAFTFTSNTSPAATLSTPTVLTQGLSGFDFSLGTGSTCTSTTTVAVGQSCTVVVQFSPKASGSRLGAVNLISGGNTIAYSFLGGTGFTPVAVYQSTTLLSTIACPNSKCGTALPNGLSNGRGITVDPAGNVWVANSTANQILQFPAGSQTPNIFTTSSTCSPVGTAIDGEGNVFYTCNGETNMYELVGGAGTPVAIPVSYNGNSYYTDDHLSVDAAGNLYPTSYGTPSNGAATNLFFKVAANTHAVTLLAAAPPVGNSPARFVGAVTDAAGNTFAPDYNNGILYELPAGSSTLRTLYNLGNTTAPHAIAEDAAGSLYVTTTIPGTTGNGSSNLLRFTAGSYTSAPASISVPGGDSLWITPDGDFYTVYSNSTLAVYSRSIFSLTFTSAVGQTSPSQTVTLENDGTAPLTISPPTSGNNPSINPSVFSYGSSSTCPDLSAMSTSFTIPASGSCSQIISFTPQQVVTYQGQLVTTDNSANVYPSTQTIKMTGTVTQGTPTVSVPAASGTLGQTATLTATITGGGVAPTGAVSFVVGSNAAVPGTCTSASGTETCNASYATSSGLTVGANTIKVSYAGDTNYLAQTGTGTLTLAPATTTSTVSSSLNPSTFGTQVTFTGKVTSTGAGTPTGQITFLDGSTALGPPVSLDSTGTATLQISTLSVTPAGTYHAITISYGGATSYATSTSTVLNQTVNKATGYTDTLSSTNQNPGYGTSITLTNVLATLGNVAPTGTVTFYNNGVQIGQPQTVDASGTAKLTTNALPVGSDRITANYSGDSNYTTNSAAITETVTAAALTTGDSALGSNTYGATPTAVTVSIPYAGPVAPTGDVTVTDNASPKNTATVHATACSTANQVLTCIVSLGTANESVGGNTVNISQAVDSNYNGSIGTGTVTISAAPATTTDKATGAGTYGAPNTAVTVTIPYVGKLSPTGDVTLSDNASPKNSVTVHASSCSAASQVLTCVITLPTANEALGPNTVNISQAADGNYNGSSGSGTVTIGPAAATSNDKATGTGTYGALNTPVTVTIPYAGVASPTGDITLSDNVTPKNTITVHASACSAANQALTCLITFPTANEPVGGNTVNVSQLADSNYNASSGTGTVTINPAPATTGDRATGSGAYGATSTPVTVTIPYAGKVAPSGDVTLSDTSTPKNSSTVHASTCSAANQVLTCLITLATANEPVGGNTVNVSQAADGNYGMSTGSGTVTIGPAAATASDRATGSGIYGAPSTSVTVTIPYAGTVAPSGDVTLSDTVTPRNTATVHATACTAANQVLTCIITLSTANEPVGGNTVNVSQAADTNYGISTGSGTVTINPAAASTNDKATGSGTYGAANTAVTVTIPYAGTASPTGDITLSDNVTPKNTITVHATACSAASQVLTCIISLPTATEPLGGNTVNVSQAADGNYGISTGGGTVTIGPAAATTTDRASGTGTYTAATTPVTVTIPYAGKASPTGDITLTDNASPVNTFTFKVSSCSAASQTLTCTVNFPTANEQVGGNPVSVSEAPDANYGGSTGGGTITIGPALATNNDKASGTGTYGAVNTSVTVTIPYAGAVPPSGSVTLSDTATPKNTLTVSASTCSAAAQVLTCVISFPTASEVLGANAVSVSQAADSNYSVSTGGGTVTIGPAAATTNDKASGSGTYGVANTPVTVTIPFAGKLSPTGDITLSDTLTPKNSVTVAASTCSAANQVLTCVISLPTASEPVGGNTVNVSEAADANYSASSGGGTVTISPAAGSTNDKASGTGAYGAANTPVLVTIPYSGTMAPTGSITLADKFGNSSTVAASGCAAGAQVLNCSISFATSSEPVGGNPVTVTEAGDNNYGASSGGGTVTINPAAATTTDKASGTGTYGAATTSVTVTIPFAGKVAPTGDITLADNASPVNSLTVKAATCSASGQTLTCTVNLPTANEPLGTNTLSISQAADGNYGGSTGTGSITIGPAATTSNDKATGTGTYGAASTAVTVTIPYAGTTAPTGAITLADTHNNSLTVQASTCTAAGGTLTCTINLPTANEPVGGNLALVSQVADNDYAGSSGSGTITINKAPATAGDTATGTGTYGAATTPITVTIPYIGQTAPTGAITIKDNLGNSVPVAASACSASGNVLTCTGNLPTASDPVSTSIPLTVTQVADGNYNGSTGTGTLAIGKAPATSTDTANGTGTYGDATTQVIVTIPFIGATAPTGSITVSDSFGNTITVLASTCVTSGGALTCTAALPTATEPTGKNPITVSQVGDGNYTGSSGGGFVTINQAGARGDDTATGSGSYGAPSTPITVVIPFSGSTSPTGGITVTDLLGNSVGINAGDCKASASALVCAATLRTANEPVGSNVVNITQAADANHASSTGTGAITINQAPATSNDTATGSGNYGNPTTAVTVTIPYAGVTAPSGAVSVTDNLGNTATAQASTCTSASQTLSCVLNLPTANEPLGSNPVTVAQAADTNYSASTGTGSVTITTSPVSPVGSTSSGVQNVTITQGTASTLLTATLAYGGAIPPSGAVNFTIGTGAPVAATCSTGGSPETCTATYPTSSLQIGTYTITATEAADANYAAGSATGTLTVAAGSVSPILDSISYVGNVLIIAGTQSATLTANITYTGPVPTGALTFNLPGGTPITATCTAGPSPLACSATYPTATLAAGTYVITALEAADSNYPQGEATALLTVSPSASTPVSPILATGSYVNSVLVPYGTASASLYATIVFNGPPPTGAVTFSVIGGTGDTPQGVCTSGASPMTCTASYPTATLGIGSYKIQVNVAADSNYPAGSAIGTLTVSEVAASTNDMVTGTGTYGAATSPITVTVAYPGSIAPTGAVTVTDSYSNTVTVQASTCTAANGTLSCPANLPTANVPVGVDKATVSQGGDAVYAPSTGAGSITIGKALATTTDTATGTGTFGTATTSISVSIPYAGVTAPTGAITIADSFNNTATVPAGNCTAASGTLSCTIALTTANEPLGNNPLTITQVGDDNYTGSTGSGTVTINKAGATTGDTATGTGTYGSATTPVTLTIPYVGSTAPTGNITLTDTHNNTVSTPAAACATTSNTITCTVNLPTASEPTGSNTVNVSQAGDSNFLGSTGTGTVTINKAPATSGDTVNGNGYYGGSTTPVTVTIPYVGAVPPSGSITVTDTHNNTITVPASSCTASNGVLTCTANLPTANEPVGSNSITVSQAPDTNYSGSTGSSTITIGKAPITTGDTATGTGIYGSPTTTVTVTIPYAGVASPTGPITLTDTLGETITVQPTACTAAAGVLTCTVSFPSSSENVGNNPITVTQAGDGNYLGSNSSGTSSSSTITINKAGPGADTATGTGTYGAATTPVSVTIPFAGAAPTGAITLTDTHGNTVTVTGCTTGSNTLACSANLPTATEPVGPNTVTVSQAADPNHSASTGTGTVTINKAPATTTDTATGTGTYGAATTAVTVTIPYVGQAAPTGAVTVSDSFGGTATVGGSTCTAAAAALTCTLNLPTVNEPVGSNPVTVTQIGDGNYVGSTGSGTVTINKAGAGADSATGTGTYGAATTAVTVTIPYPGAVPTGAIVLADTHNNTVNIPAANCTAAGNVLTCTTNLPTASEPVGSNSVTINQAADPNHSASTGTGTVTINKAPATSTDTVAGTGTYGNATSTVTVTVPYVGAVAPTGAITISDSLGNTVTVQASTCTAAAGLLTCSATLPTVNEPLGSNQLTVTQAPDGNYGGSTGKGSVTINKPGATNGDTVTGTTTYGAATTPVTVTIPYIGNTAPTGAITLTDTHGNTVTVQASACTAAKAILTCTASMPSANVPVGSDTITVNQAADAIFNGSTGTGSVTVNKAAATTGDTVTGSGNFGDATTSVTVSIPFVGATAPTGAVTVADSNGHTVTVQASTCTTAKAMLTCTASLPTANDPIGANTLTVTQAADANYSGSTGTGTVTLGKTKPTLTAPTITPLNSTFGASVTITQTVPKDETGTVTFLNGTTVLGTGTIANGVATLTTSALPVGPDSITATANGDGNYAAATSPAVTDTIAAATTTVALASSQSTMAFGTNVTFTATVSTPGSTPVAGTVTFSDGTTVIGTATVSNGVATASTATLAVGTHSITAAFTPATGSPLTGATSTAVSQVVTAAVSSITLSSSQNPAIVGQSVTLSAAVSASIPGTTPTGKVTFLDGTTVIGTAQLSASGTASLATSALTGGSHDITAVYAGDGAYATSTSAVVAQKVSDFTVGNTTPTMSADPGAAAAFNITVNPVGSISFNPAVVLTVTGLPAKYTAAFAQGSVTPGSAGTATTMTVQTFAQALTAMEHEHHVKSLEAAAAWACLFPLLGLRRVRRRLPKALLMLVLMLGSFGVIAPLTGCGGGYFGPQPASYTLTVTGTSGTLQRSTTVTLNVR